jgi:hypothetical protein
VKKLIGGLSDEWVDLTPRNGTTPSESCICIQVDNSFYEEIRKKSRNMSRSDFHREVLTE